MCITINNNGCNLFVRKEGEGPSVLLIHGAGSDSSFFAPAVSILKEDFAVLTYDRCGCTQSVFINKDIAEDPARYSVSQQALDAKAVLDAFDLKQVMVVGFSAGGLVALELARQYPEYVRQLMLYEPALAGGKAGREGLTEWMDRLQEAADKKRIANALLIFMNALGGIDEKAPRKSMDQQVQSLKNLQVFLDYEMHDFLTFADRLEGGPDLKMPCILGIGTLHEEGMLSKSAAENADWIGARLEYVEGYHNFPEDRPEEFAKWVKKGQDAKASL